MKKSIIRIISTALIAVMLFGISACGNANGSNSASKNAAETPAPDFVYKSEFKTLKKDSKEGVYPSLYTDNGFYYTVSEKVGEEIPEGAVIEWEGQYDVYQEFLYFMDFDGNTKKLSDYKPLKPAEKIEGHDYYSYSNGLMIFDGYLYSIVQLSENWSDAPEDVEKWSDDWYNYYQYTSEYYLRKFDENGGELFSKKLEVPGDTDYSGGFYIYNTLIDGGGNIIVCSDMMIIIYDTDGNNKGTITINDNWIDGLLQLKDGSVVAKIYGDGYELRVVDTASRTLGEPVKLDTYFYNVVSGVDGYDFCYTNGLNFMGFDLASGKAEKLFNWLNCDVNSDDLSTVSVTEDGAIIGIINEWDSDYEKVDTILIKITKVPYDPSAEKQTITLATQSLDWNVKSTLIKFNRSNPDFRIEVIDYSEYNTEEDYSAGLTKLKTELLAGNTPDIIDLNQMPMEQLAAKGILEDLYPYIDNDSELSRDDFFSNMLGALEVNGKLCTTLSSFYINTLCGAASIVGEKPGWTLADLKESLSKMPEGCDILSYYSTRNDILYNLVNQTMGEFVDWSTGKCSFETQYFIDVLEFANQFPAEFNWENYEYTEDDDDYSRISQGRQLLLQGYISSFDDLEYYNHAFGGDMTFIGYPTSTGNGAIMNLNTGYGISSSCKNKDQAWQFLRILMTEEYQSSDNIYNFPCNVNAFNKKLEKAMTPEYERDINGNYVLDENGEKIELSRGGYGFSDGSTYDIYSLSKEMGDKVVELVKGTTMIASTNDDIMDIINAEVEAYFSGQKTAQEVAKLIQSKVSIYVSEHM